MTENCSPSFLQKFGREECGRNVITGGGTDVIMRKFIRKIRKVSTHSYAIVVPKQLIKEFGWKERQKVVILFGGRKHELTIRDWKRKA